MTLKLIPLHHQPNLLNDCCELLNTEWKKNSSLTVRSSSLMQSSDKLPCSLVLLCDQTVIGHIRLLGVIGEEKTVFLTSVIIAPHFRKCGLGRKLLEMTEGYARNKGYISMCLSSVSNGAEKFYEKCGFYVSEPVQPAKQEKLNAKIEMLQKKNTEANTQKQSYKSEHMQAENLIKPIVESKGIPPPPPLLPSSWKTPLTVKSVENIWMRKDLIPTDCFCVKVDVADKAYVYH